MYGNLSLEYLLNLMISNMMEWSRVREGGLKQFQGFWGGGGREGKTSHNL